MIDGVRCTVHGVSGKTGGPVLAMADSAADHRTTGAIGLQLHVFSLHYGRSMGETVASRLPFTIVRHMIGGKHEMWEDGFMAGWNCHADVEFDIGGRMPCAAKATCQG